MIQRFLSRVDAGPAVGLEFSGLLLTVGPKYHSDDSYWAPIPHYLDPWTSRVH